MKNIDLIVLEKQALLSSKNKQYKQAAILFEKILEENPNWEHGGGYYNLAGCYEDMQEFDKAKEAYKNAIKLDGSNAVFVGAYASFLYLYGNTMEAFEWHLKLLNLECVHENPKFPNDIVKNNIKNMLYKLGDNLCYTKQEVSRYIVDAENGIIRCFSTNEVK